MKRTQIAFFVPFAAIVAAMAIRTACVGWGLPRQGQPFSFYGDEHSIPFILSTMEPEKLNFRLHNYVNPGLHTYTMALAFKLAETTGAIELVNEKEFYRSNVDMRRRMFLLGRLVSLAYAAGTMILAYLILAALKTGPGATTVSLLGLGLFSSHISQSAIMATNVPVVSWIMASLLLMIRALQNRRKSTLYWSALVFGIACSTKLNAAPLFFPLAYVSYVITDSRSLLTRDFLVTAFKALGLAALIFVLTNPYLFMDLRDLPTQLGWFGTVIRPATSWRNYLYFPVQSLLLDLGPVFSLCFVYAVWDCLRRRDRLEAPIIIFLISSVIMYISYQSLASSSRVLPAFAVFFLLAGRSVDHLWRKQRTRRLGIGFAALVLLPTAFGGILTTALMTGKTVNQEAGKWVEANIPPGSTVALFQPPHRNIAPVSISNDFHYRDEQQWRYSFPDDPHTPEFTVQFDFLIDMQSRAPESSFFPPARKLAHQCQKQAEFIENAGLAKLKSFRSRVSFGPLVFHPRIWPVTTTIAIYGQRGSD